MINSRQRAAQNIVQSAYLGLLQLITDTNKISGHSLVVKSVKKIVSLSLSMRCRDAAREISTAGGHSGYEIGQSIRGPFIVRTNISTPEPAGIENIDTFLISWMDRNLNIAESKLTSEQFAFPVYWDFISFINKLICSMDNSKALEFSLSKTSSRKASPHSLFIPTFDFNTHPRKIQGSFSLHKKTLGLF